jgi:hypothetical protein
MVTLSAEARLKARAVYRLALLRKLADVHKLVVVDRSHHNHLWQRFILHLCEMKPLCLGSHVASRQVPQPRVQARFLRFAVFAET